MAAPTVFFIRVTGPQLFLTFDQPMIFGDDGTTGFSLNTGERLTWGNLLGNGIDPSYITWDLVPEATNRPMILTYAQPGDGLKNEAGELLLGFSLPVDINSAPEIEDPEMANAFYDELALDALALLEEFGAPVSINRTSGEVFDPDDGSITTPGTLTEHAPNAVFGAMTKKNAERFTGVVKASEKMLTLDATLAPLLTDTISKDGVDWSVVEVQELAPAGVPVVYYLRIER